MLYWAIELDGRWFCMKHNCWRPHLEEDCVYATQKDAVFFYERWLNDEERTRAKVVPFELRRVPLED